MRIACVHIPQFALQCATRVDPALRRPEPGAPVVVVGAALEGHEVRGARSVLHAPVVLACSRAAWALGARIGMTATTARNLSPEIEVVTADAQLERDTVRAIADTILAATPVVDLGGRVGPGGAHLALYCEVPAKTRGASFGEKLLDRLGALGLTGRIGIADDRFTAWVAAWLGAWDTPARHDDTGITSVPRGGSAAFLAPRPLSLLSISPEVQHMLEALGVRTLGEFAALPAPTVSSRAARFEADYQALARGESGNVLRPYAPDAPIREEAVVTSRRHAATESTHALSAPAAIALLAERIAMRLHGRARGAARLEVTVAFGVGERVIPIAPVRDGQGVLTSAEAIAEAIGSALGDGIANAWRLRVVVTGEALGGEVTDVVDDELAVPAQRAFAAAFGSARSTADHDADRSPHAEGVPADAVIAEGSGARDALSVVLSTTGSAVDRLFGLTAPIAERRDAHRRTRRGKHRRRTTPIGSTIQPRLFKM